MKVRTLHLKFAAVTLLLAGLATACGSGPSEELLAQLKKDRQRFEEAELRFLKHYDELDILKDNLNQQFVRGLNNRGKERLMQDSSAVKLYDRLMLEYQENERAYAAFLKEYHAWLSSYDLWLESLPETRYTESDVRQEWEERKQQFQEFLKAEARLQDNVEMWETAFRKRTTDFRIRFNYGETEEPR